MWIMTKNGDLVNIDKMTGIGKVEVPRSMKFHVVALAGDEDNTRYQLRAYDTAEQAQDAITEIYKHLEKGDTAMKMPVWNW